MSIEDLEEPESAVAFKSLEASRRPFGLKASPNVTRPVTICAVMTVVANGDVTFQNSSAPVITADSAIPSGPYRRLTASSLPSGLKARLVTRLWLAPALKSIVFASPPCWITDVTSPSWIVPVVFVVASNVPSGLSASERYPPLDGGKLEFTSATSTLQSLTVLSACWQ